MLRGATCGSTYHKVRHVPWLLVRLSAASLGFPPRRNSCRRTSHKITIEMNQEGTNQGADPSSCQLPRRRNPLTMASKALCQRADHPSRLMSHLAVHFGTKYNLTRLQVSRTLFLRHVSNMADDKVDAHHLSKPVIESDDKYNNPWGTWQVLHWYHSRKCPDITSHG